MKSFFASFLLVVSVVRTNAQCLNIESILVDACSPPSACGTFSAEGQNEMVLFKVGNANLNVSSLTVNWPNNTFKGWSQNATTAANVSYLNGTILSCGYLKEPTGGVLPANKRVLAITSESMCLAANSFANLDDTLIVIFQTAGNTSGHFVNTNNSAAITASPTGASSTRTLQFIYTPNSCTNTVIYDRSLLTNSLGTYGGSTSQNDGAKVNFDVLGNATYTNLSCQAPFIPLTVTASSPAQGYCPGSPAPLTATVQGNNYSVIWTGGNGTITAATSLTTSYIPSSSESGAVSLTCTVNKPCGTYTITASSTVTVNVLQAPQASVASVSGNSLCPGNTATLSSSILNSGVAGFVSYNWLPGNISSSSYTTGNAGTFTLDVSNSCGSNSYTAQIIALANPTISLSASSYTLCAGNSVTLTASASAGTYTWNTGSNASSIVVSPSVNAVFTASTSNTCSTVSASDNLTVTPQPTVSLNASLFNICGTQSATIVATAASGQFSWSTGASTNSIVTSTGGVYTVTVTNVCNSVVETATVNVGAAPAFTINAASSQICPGQTVALLPAGSTGTMVWSTGATSQSISVSQAGVYSATLSNNCGAAFNSVTITAASLPTVGVSASSNTICSGGSILVTANGSAGTYSWNTSQTTNTLLVTQPGIYSATVSNICGTANASVAIIPGAPPSVSIVPVSTLMCSGAAASLTAISADGGLTYSWSQGANTPSITTTTAGTYTAVVTNSCGSASASFNVSFMQLPTVSLVSNQISLCADSGAVLSAFGSGNGTYQWPSFPLNSAAVQSVTAPGFYVVNYSNACGTASAGLSIGASTLTADFSFSPLTASAPAAISFSNLSQNNFNNQWTFGNGQSATTVNANTNYAMAGSYAVTLIIENADGCPASVTKYVEITNPLLGEVPELITPNNDGKNDVFEIKGLESYPNNRLQIFNRWGNEVYFANPYLNTWNGVPHAPGASSGGRLPSGTYYYLLQLGDAENTTKKGMIQVVY